MYALREEGGTLVPESVDNNKVTHLVYILIDKISP